MTVLVYTGLYEALRGGRPCGVATWTFRAGGEVFETTGWYAAARRDAIEWARDRNYGRIDLVG